MSSVKPSKTVFESDHNAKGLSLLSDVLKAKDVVVVLLRTGDKIKCSLKARMSGQKTVNLRVDVCDDGYPYSSICVTCSHRFYTLVEKITVKRNGVDVFNLTINPRENPDQHNTVGRSARTVAVKNPLFTVKDEDTNESKLEQVIESVQANDIIFFHPRDENGASIRTKYHHKLRIQKMLIGLAFETLKTVSIANNTSSFARWSGLTVCRGDQTSHVKFAVC